MEGLISRIFFDCVSACVIFFFKKGNTLRFAHYPFPFLSLLTHTLKIAYEYIQPINKAIQSAYQVTHEMAHPQSYRISKQSPHTGKYNFRQGNREKKEFKKKPKTLKPYFPFSFSYLSPLSHTTK